MVSSSVKTFVLLVGVVAIAAVLGRFAAFNITW
jgi:low affinity Fe/Cu permease